MANSGDTFNVKQVRERYGVSMWVVYYWIDRGLITAQKRKLGLPYVITVGMIRWIRHKHHIPSPPLPTARARM